MANSNKKLGWFLKAKRLRFNWTSSVNGNSATLLELQKKMDIFYSTYDGRRSYQDHLNMQSENLRDSGQSVPDLMTKYVSCLKPDNVLEIGCGNGRLYRQLLLRGWKGGVYSGIDLEQQLIENNLKRHSECQWQRASVYAIPYPDNLFGVCYALYVLEHLVYPEKALREMIRVVKPGGHIVLAFPDFVAAGYLASQYVGFTDGRFMEKIKKRAFLDALIGLVTSRLILPRALKNASKKYGPFPVNCAPKALDHKSFPGSDSDAVYITSKVEIESWARALGHKSYYPFGVKGVFNNIAFIDITKESGSVPK